MTLLRPGLMAATLLLLVAPLRGDEWTPTPQSRASDIDVKLKSIVVSVDFNHAKIDEALAALTVMSRQLDPDHKGVNYVLQPEAASTAQPITLKLSNVPLRETLRYVCELGRVHCRIDEQLVSITPLYGEDWMVKRTFHVDPSFVESVSSAGVIPSPSTTTP